MYLCSKFLRRPQEVPQKVSSRAAADPVWQLKILPYPKLLYAKDFSVEQRLRLAEITALWLASGKITPTILNLFINEDKVKDEISLNFFMDILITLKVMF